MIWRNLVVLLFAIAGAFFIGSQMVSFLFNVQTNRGRFRKELAKLRELLLPKMSFLAPWNKQEIELLSVEVSDVKVKRGINTTITGELLNIYHEPVVDFALRRYFGNNKNAILLAKTTTDEFVYAFGKNKIKLWINRDVVGTIDHDGSLYDMEGKLELKMLQKDKLSLLPITKEGKEIAGLNNPANNFSGNNRALQFFTTVDDSDSQKILAMSVLELLTYEIM